MRTAYLEKLQGLTKSTSDDFLTNTPIFRHRIRLVRKSDPTRVRGHSVAWPTSRRPPQHSSPLTTMASRETIKADVRP